MTSHLLAAVVLANLLFASVGAQEPTFRAEARLVVLHATVRNSRGELISNLEKGAFTVDQNGTRQAITLFHRDDVPVSIGLVIDNSGSMRTSRAQVEAAALAFVRASHPLDEVFVVNFAAKARRRRRDDKRRSPSRGGHYSRRGHRRHRDPGCSDSGPELSQRPTDCTIGGCCLSSRMATTIPAWPRGISFGK